MAGIWKVKERVNIILFAVVFNVITNIMLINFIWVYGAALATWIWWFIIYILSEYVLRKTYKVTIEYKFLLKNLVFIWLLWIFSYYMIVPIFLWFDRWLSFWYMSIIWILWFILVWIINLKEFKSFILEIKKIKWKES
jgi:hypothetical protein